jgi:hypothetical protein
MSPRAQVNIHIGISKVLAAQQGPYFYTRYVCDENIGGAPF